ncbi:hypothetical protein ACU18_00105 [Arthrobacter sp. ZBG10]|uniref:O-antigen ligase family protein n=1 Tax=Arthrobacter sp. ZBG10 TaxID=1676590 RepID=UPI000682F764|nr:O-antigen ligase family protein [Arthrobacter sp. ZBG10]KNH23194.1 hypothetical protein ACU18_00105 [Arthrobacter sp. ZBG10]
MGEFSMGDFSVKWLAVGLGVTGILVAAAVLAPSYLGLALAGAVVIAVATKPVGRLALFVIGGLVAMGGTSGLGATKIGYAALIALLVVVGLQRILAEKDEAWQRLIRPALATSGLLGLLTTIAAFVGAIQGNPLTLIGQDAFTYALLAAAPIIGVDAAIGGTFKRLKPLVAVVGVVAASSWAVWWLARRGSAIGGLDRILLSSSFLGFAVFAIALVLAVNSRSGIARTGWGFLAIAIPLVYIASGSRSMVVFALGIIGVLGAQKVGRLPLTKTVLAGVVACATALWALPYIFQALPDGDRILRRFAGIGELLGSSQGIESDGSYVERARAYKITTDMFLNFPILGQGFGHRYPSVSGLTEGDLKVDSPLLIFAKFGIIGTAMLLAVLWQLWRLSLETRGPGELRLGGTVIRVFACITVGRLFFVAPTEDKGTAYALALIICFALIACRQDRHVFGEAESPPTATRQTQKTGPPPTPEPKRTRQHSTFP